MFSVILVIVPVAESVAATANPHQYIYLLPFFPSRSTRGIGAEADAGVGPGSSGDVIEGLRTYNSETEAHFTATGLPSQCNNSDGGQVEIGLTKKKKSTHQKLVLRTIPSARRAVSCAAACTRAAAAIAGGTGDPFTNVLFNVMTCLTPPLLAPTTPTDRVSISASARLLNPSDPSDPDPTPFAPFAHPSPVRTRSEARVKPPTERPTEEIPGLTTGCARSVELIWKPGVCARTPRVPM